MKSGSINNRARKSVKKRAHCEYMDGILWGRCEHCGKWRPLFLYHVVFRGHVRETEQNMCMLCFECHDGTNGVHGKNGSYLDKELKIRCQRQYIIMGYPIEKVRKLMGGRLYG